MECCESIKNISEGNLCTGCGACSFICPAGCIERYYDGEGFLRFRVLERHCVHCGKCLTVCPIVNKALNPAMKVIAYQINQEYQPEESTSGGAFYAAAMVVLSQGGMVCSAVDEIEQGGSYCLSSSFEGIERMRKSKYYRIDLTQEIVSRIADEVKSSLVLFCGLPCQVHAIASIVPARFRKNLITADLICQGTPSYYVVQRYRESIAKKANEELALHEFRAKGHHGRRYVSRIVFKDGREMLQEGDTDVYNCSFSHKLFLREACYKCPFAASERVGDITIGDFWGLVDFAGDKERNTSVVFANTNKGKQLLEEMCRFGYSEKRPLSDIADNNAPLNHPCIRPKSRSISFALLRHFGLKSAVAICYPKVILKKAASRLRGPND